MQVSTTTDKEEAEENDSNISSHFSSPDMLQRDTPFTEALGNKAEQSLKIPTFDNTAPGSLKIPTFDNTAPGMIIIETQNGDFQYLPDGSSKCIVNNSEEPCDPRYLNTMVPNQIHCSQPTPRRKYSMKFKLEVVAFAKTHSLNKTAEHFGVHRKMVKEWKKREEQLKLTKNGESKFRLLGNCERSKYVGLEQDLALFFLQCRSNNIYLSSTHLKQKAISIYHDLVEQNKAKPHEFQASNGWFSRFMNRHRLSLRMSMEECLQRIEEINNPPETVKDGCDNNEVLVDNSIDNGVSNEISLGHTSTQQSDSQLVNNPTNGTASLSNSHVKSTADPSGTTCSTSHNLVFQDKASLISNDGQVTIIVETNECNSFPANVKSLGQMNLLAQPSNCVSQTNPVIKCQASPRRKYSLTFKSEVASYAKNHSLQETSKVYGVHRRMVKQWKQQLDTFTKMENGDSRYRLKGCGGKPKFLDLEEVLSSYFLQCRASEIYLSHSELKRKALDIFNEMVSDGTLDQQEFIASTGWLNRFLARHHLSSDMSPEECTRRIAEQDGHVFKLEPADTSLCEANEQSSISSTALFEQYPDNISTLSNS